MEKSNDELLAILAHPEDWQPQVLEAAKAQLQKQGVQSGTIRPKADQGPTPPIVAQGQVPQHHAREAQRP